MIRLIMKWHLRRASSKPSIVGAKGSSTEGVGNVTTFGGSLATVVTSTKLPSDDSASGPEVRSLSNLVESASLFLLAASLACSTVAV